MIKIENIEVQGFKAAIRGMRNPLNSWNKADSSFNNNTPVLGENDLKLCKLLIKAGSSDRKFLRMIHVTWDVTAPLYLWKEADQYRIACTTNSCSTMHKIHSRDLNIEDFSYDHLNEESKENLLKTIGVINKNRKLYKETNDKEYWWQMIQLLPSSYNQMRTWDLDYETLINIYFSRRYHKLDEWHVLCDKILELPYMKDFIEVLEN
jgi:hypothetical protein